MENPEVEQNPVEIQHSFDTYRTEMPSGGFFLIFIDHICRRANAYIRRNMNNYRNSSSVGCIGIIGNLGIVIGGLAAIAWFLEHYIQIMGLGWTVNGGFQRMIALVMGQ